MNEVSYTPRAMKKRKFYCCTCGEKLIVYPKVRVIKRGDPDYKKHQRLRAGSYLVGDIELVEHDFKCMSCEKFISYDEQCIIEEIQKQLGMHILTEDNIRENSEKAKATLDRKSKRKLLIRRIIGALLVLLMIIYLIKTGNFSLKFFL